MPSKICRDCNKSFDQFTTIQNRCGPCSYAYSMAIANSSKRAPIKPAGKQDSKWRRTRAAWIKNNPPIDNIWACHYCGIPLTIDSDLLNLGVEILTLDHVKNRNHSELRHKFSNLLPCCRADNTLKGSMSYEQFCSKYYPKLAKKLDWATNA